MIWTPLLLADPSPCLRWLVLKDLMTRGDDDPEVIELARMRENDPLVSDLVTAQAKDGSWSSGYLGGADGVERIHATSHALFRLGYLGFDGTFPAVKKGAEFILSLQNGDGSWPLPRNRTAGYPT